MVGKFNTIATYIKKFNVFFNKIDVIRSNVINCQI